MGRVNPLEETTKKTTGSKTTKKTTKVVKGDPKLKAAKATIELDNGYDATTVKVQFEKVKVSKRPNYDALSDEVKNLHNLAMTYESKIIEYSSSEDGSDAFCFPLMYHSMMVKFLETSAVAIIDAKFKDLKIALSNKIDFDKIEKHDIMYISLLSKLKNIEKGISTIRRLRYAIPDSFDAKGVNNDELFDMLNLYSQIIRILGLIFNDANLKYDNAWIEEELNKTEFITKLTLAAPGTDFTILKNKKTHLYVRTLSSSIKLFLITDKHKFNIDLNIDGSKLTMFKECPTHAVSVENASLEISTLPSDFMHLVSSIFKR